jgi:type IV pilus assembly protein PilB
MHTETAPLMELEPEALIELGTADLTPLPPRSAAVSEPTGLSGVGLAPPGNATPKNGAAPVAQVRKRLGELLEEAGLVTYHQLAQALAYQKAHGGRLGQVLVQLGMLEEGVLESQLARQLGLTVREVDSIDPAPAVLQLLSEDQIRRLEVIPLRREGSHLVVGMVDPCNLALRAEVGNSVGGIPLRVEMITEATLKRFLDTRFAREDFARLEELGHELTRSGGQNANIVKIVDRLVEAAVRNRASDIHIEPYESFFRVRFRIDGALYTVLTLPSELQSSMVSRVKVLANMDISERRKPQDGHIRIKVEGSHTDLRVSTLPTVFGEKCVMRLLKKESHLADITALGFRKEQLAKVREVVALPQGMVLVTGPTGSGKTTTLHAMLNLINESDINIVTIEDPVETAIPGINHVPIADKGGVSFAAALSSILRQDPDVVFVGEMRDKEVSAIAVKAALTGHLVLSTLHTNGVVETFARLMDMGIDTYLLASSVELVIAQRLLRRVCPRCAVRVEVEAGDIEEFGLTAEQLSTAACRVGAGCGVCLRTGYRGRVAVYEMLSPSSEVRRILRKGGNEQAIAEAVAKEGMLSMRDAGVARALAGETTFAEVRRTCSLGMR